MVKVTLVRSTNGEIASVKATVAALGLKKIRQSKTLRKRPRIWDRLKRFLIWYRLKRFNLKHSEALQRRGLPLRKQEQL